MQVFAHSEVQRAAAVPTAKTHVFLVKGVCVCVWVYWL